jgi:hypothetical protein
MSGAPAADNRLSAVWPKSAGPRARRAGTNLFLTATAGQGYECPSMAVGHMRGITAIVMAYAVMLILVSPLVPSPLTTVRSKQMVQPPHLVAPVAALLFTAVADCARTFWLMEEPERLLTRVPTSST